MTRTSSTPLHDKRHFRALVLVAVACAVACIAVTPFAGAVAALLGVASVVVAVVAWGRARPGDSRGLRLGATAFVAALLVGLVVAGSQGAGSPALGGDSASDLSTVGTSDGEPTSGTSIVNDVSATVEPFHAATKKSTAGVPIVVTNAGDTSHGVTVELAAHDPAGNGVARTTVDVPDLASGESRTVIAFGDADKATQKKLATATVDVVGISGA